MQGNLPATNLFNLGMELFTQVQRITSSSKVRALRIKLGNHVLKEIPVSPLTAAATLFVVALAVIVSTLTIEVDHEPTSFAE